MATIDFEQKTKETRLILISLYILTGLIALSICLFILLHQYQQDLVELGEIRYQSNLLADQLRQSSDDLTRMVRTYAATGNEKFERQYWEVLAIRNGETPRPFNYDRIYWDFLSVENGSAPYPSGQAKSLKLLMKEAGFTDREFALLEEAQQYSDDLVLLEKVAMDAMKQDPPDRQKALDILFGEQYHQAKVKIMRPINTFLDELNQRTGKEVHRGALFLQSFLSVQIITYILTIIILVFLMRTAKSYHSNMVSVLARTVKQRTEELLKSYTDLKKETTERKLAEQQIKILSGLIPICAKCKKIRDDTGYWNQIEEYIQEHSEALFSHSICPECAKKLYPEFYKDQ